MKTFILTTAIALSLAAPAVASDQLARTLGVEPGAFTTAELVQLNRAYEENDQTTVNFILSGGSNLDAATAESRGLQLAIDHAVEQGDYAHARNLEARQAAPSSITMSARDAADVPAFARDAAAALGVNTADFTVGELVALARFHQEGDTARVQGMISRVTN